MLKANQVLFIDDEIFLTRQYINALMDSGFNITAADSVETAIDFARSRKFQIVVLDVMMPSEGIFEPIETAGGYKTGIALARELKYLLPDAKIVALTNSTDPEVEEWFTLDSSVAYLYKGDVLPSHLPHRLNMILNRGEELPQPFIVYGRDQKTAMELKKFLKEKLNLGDPILLSEKQSQGRTLIEKFEYYAAGIDIVFVLITPDDVGHLTGAPELVQARARQNVIFECGYFLGSLHRRSGKILLLYKGPLELPSDINGIIYIDISNGIEEAEEQIRNELADWL